MGTLLEGHIAVVTGAGSGIGRAIAKGYAAEGAKVMAADINAAGASETAAMIADAGGTSMDSALDVTDRSSCAALANKVMAELGPASVLVNNAGIVRRAPISAQGADQDWDDIMNVNATGVYNVTKAFLDPLRENKGRIVNIGSIQSFVHTGNAAAYTVAKHGVLGFTRALAAELGPDGIRVNAIGPGLIRTPLNAENRANTDMEARFVAQTPLRRAGEAEDIAGPAIFLASDMSGFVTGAYVPVDGGYLTL
ncbi:MAG: SDR family NAD(P)-dependent oxidoreductase [Rhodospirillaceae bacterium]|nr:SDR family NAD(P)-dependent oxidoreductase [Rhodospirillaceae bacterium]MDD9924209.1 SDR family NAD(P)-dependent oxidoreductase [Rhodospirillaceae bacterium]